MNRRCARGHPPWRLRRDKGIAIVPAGMRRSRPRSALARRAAAFALAGTLGSGCATKALRGAAAREWIEASRPGVPAGRGPGLAARQWLHRAGLEDLWRRDPGAAIDAIPSRLSATDGPAARAAAAELCLEAGRRAGTPEERRRRAMAAAGHAYAGLAATRPGPGLLAPDVRNAAEVYNAALADYLLALESGLPRAETLGTNGAAIRVDPASVLAAGVTNLDVARREAPRVEEQINRRYGVGAAVTAYRPVEVLVPAREPWHPQVRVLPVRPATLLARFDRAGDGAATATLTLHDPIESATARLGPVEVPLEADLAVPLARVLDENAAYRGLARMPLYLDGDFAADLRGLHMLGPYRPGRVPVVLVHGLMDSPFTWMPLANEILRDPALAARVQVWAFFYATVNPIAQSAAELRHSIEALRARVDPAGIDVAWDRMVLVGHSMGGLISRMLVSRGTIAPAPELAAAGAALPEDRRAYLESIGRLEPLPCVRRAILLGAPNRGAEMASSMVGRLGNALISLPTATIDFLGPGPSSGLKPVAAPTGIRNLRPESAFIRSLSGLPLPDGVPVHTIAADLDAAGRTGGTDGVVPYASSHLDGAASELVVRGDHLSMHKEPPAIQEVLRILREHAGQDGGTAQR